MICPLTASYDVALLDLDGVVYVGTKPVPGAPEALTAVRNAGMRLAYVTNNASRRAAEVATMLTRMGIPAGIDDVVTSAQAAAHLLQERLPAGSAVLIVGTDALAEEVRDVGLIAVRTADPIPAAVVQGYGPDVGQRELAEATVAIRGGALWIATNTDSTVPSARGPLPGNGALVAALQLATQTRPEVVGKPHPGLHRECVLRTGARHPLIVGDRLDTDIEGACAAGVDSMLVLSGVSSPAALLAAPRGQRPTYVASDLAGLLQQHDALAANDDGTAVHGNFRAAWDGPDLVLSGAGDDPLHALRALCAATWAADRSPAAVRGENADTSGVLNVLGLGGEVAS